MYKIAAGVSIGACLLGGYENYRSVGLVTYESFVVLFDLIFFSNTLS